MTFSEQDDQAGEQDSTTDQTGTAHQSGDQGGTTDDQAGGQDTTTDQTGTTDQTDAADTAPAIVAENSPVSVGEIPDDPAVLAQIDTSWSTDTEVA